MNFVAYYVVLAVTTFGFGWWCGRGRVPLRLTFAGSGTLCLVLFLYSRLIGLLP